MKKLYSPFFLRTAFVVLFMLSFVRGWGQTNIIPIRTDVGGFGTWADTNILGSTYLQLTTNTSTTISPSMSFEGYTSITLDYKARMFGGPNTAEKVITVSISTDGATWTILGTNSPSNTTLTSVTQYNLASYIGQSSVRLRFQTLSASSGKGSGIDDIDIKGVLPTCTPPATPTGTISGITPACTSTTLTYTHGSGQPVADIEYYWQTSATGTSTSPANLASITFSTTSANNFVRAYNSATNCWSAPTANYPVVINSTIGTLATAPSPSNASTGVCYSGTGAITALNWTAATGATSYDVYFGTTSLPGSPVNVATNSYNVGTLLPNTTYQWRIVPRNGCGITTGTPTTWTFTTAAGICYCMPNQTNSNTVDLVTNISITNSLSANYSNATTEPSGYIYVNNLPAFDLVQSSTTNTIAITFGTDSTRWSGAWIDFNQNGTFETSEAIGMATTAAVPSGTITYTFTVPSGALTGVTRLRVRGNADGGSNPYNVATGACITTPYGDSEDYNVNIIASCTPPANPAGTISGTTPACASTDLTYNGADFANAYWQTSATGTSTLEPVGSTSTVKTVSTSGTYYVRIYAGACWSTTAVSHTVVINTTPVITTEPVNQNVVSGTATFTVAATGGDLSYAWEVSTDCGANWSAIGTNSASLTTASVTPSMNGNVYRVTVTNGCGTATSTVAYLNVVNESECLNTDFATAEGWPANTGYTSNTYIVNGRTWITNGINIVGGSSRVQIRDLDAWIQLPDLAYPLSLNFDASSSGGGNGNSTSITVQAFVSGAWQDINTYSFTTSANNTVNLSSFSAEPVVKIRFIKRSTDLYATFLDKVKVNCTTPPTTPTDYTWTGNGGNTSWTTACNWLPKGVPTAIDNVTINTAPSQILNIVDSRTVNDFTFNGTGNFNASATGILTINGNVTYGGTANAVLDCASQVFITSSSEQIIPPLTYGSLNALGGNRILSSTGIIKICNGLAVNKDLHQYEVDGSTVEYISSGSWSMRPFTYHNLTFSGSATFALGGNFSATYTGTKTVNVLGDFTQSAGTFLLVPTATYTTYNPATLNVEGNMIISGGTFNMKNGSSANASTINLKGDLTVSSSGIFTANNISDVAFNFSGTGNGLTPETTQDINVTNVSTTANIAFNVNPGAYAKLISQDLALGTNSKFNVSTGATLDFGFDGTNALNIVRVQSPTLAAGQSFTSQTNSTLIITSPEGISNGTSVYTGNVQVGSSTTNRVFAPNATYHYKGKANAAQVTANQVDQISGNGLPSDASAKNIIVELDTNNAAQDDVKFKANGINKFTSTGSLKIIKGTVIDEAGNGFEDGTTEDGKLIMTGGRYKISRGGTQPGIGGDYELTGGVIEFAGSTSLQQIRTGSTPKQYLNVEVSGTNVEAGTTTTGGLTFQSGGSFTVKPTGVFKVNNPDGFSGGSVTAIKNTNTPSITLEPTSTIEYNGDSQTVTNAAITSPATANYQTLKISGTGIKTAKGTTTVNEMTQITAATTKLVVPSPSPATEENVFYALGGIENTDLAGDVTGDFIIANDAMLMQNPSADNSKAVIKSRKLHTYKNDERKEYNFLSSPVTKQNMKAIYGNNAANVPFVTKLNEPTNFFVNATSADWDGDDDRAKGFAVREPRSTGFVPDPTDSLPDTIAQYKGKPNNGDIDLILTYTLNRGYHLAGNPYPSNIDILDLYTNSTDIDPTFRFWDNTVNSLYTQQGGAYKGYSYALFNATTDSGYGTNAPGVVDGDAERRPNQVIKVSQAFMIRAKNGNAKLKFKNDQRKTTAGTQFFGKSSTKNRYHLELVKTDGFTVQNGIAYFDAGNQAFGLEDSRIPNAESSDALFSFAGDAKVVINGRSTFATEDVVTLGLRHFTAGTYKIQVVDEEGVFANGQKIYLKDKQLNILTDLTAGNYTFTSEPGEFTNRFEIVYKDGLVLTTDATEKSSIQVYRDGTNFVVKSTTKNINTFELYDASGRLVLTKQPKAKQLTFDSEILAEGMYILKAVMENGEQLTKKIRK